MVEDDDCGFPPLRKGDYEDPLPQPARNELTFGGADGGDGRRDGVAAAVRRQRRFLAPTRWPVEAAGPSRAPRRRRPAPGSP